MRFSKVAAVAALSAVGDAQRPTNTSICDYYTTALLKNNTAANQATILTLLVNTVVIGNYTKPKIEGVTFPDVKVPGILANGTVNGTEVNLLPYFNGGLASSNRGGNSGVAVNFLDDGGAVPLMNNKPANGTSSNQYFLLTHLYQFFGTLLGCSEQGMTGFDKYSGEASMYSVHKYMALDYAQNTYFIQQVALAAESFGVAMSDIQAVGKSLNGAFNVRCGPNATVIPSQGPAEQSICITSDCPVAANASCSAYAAVVEPGVANSTLAMGEGNSSSTATMAAPNGGTPTASGGAGSTASPTGAASKAAVGAAAGLLGVAAFFL